MRRRRRRGCRRNCRHPKVPKTQRATQTPRPIQQAQPAKPQQQPARTATATTQSRPATSTAAAAAPVKMSWASVVQAPRPVREDPDDAFSTGVESDKVTVIVYCKSTFWRYHHYSTPDVVARILIDSRRQNFSEDELAKSVHNMVNILAVQMGELTNNVQALSAQLESAFKWPVPVPMPESLIIPPDDFPSACGGTSASSRSKAPPKPEFRVDPAGIKAIRALAGGILFPVGVVGNLREGKSTLQNLILRAALPQTEGMAAQSEIFPTSNAYWSKTKGCSFVLVPHPSVQDGWILLFDFEGFGELTKDQSYCADYDARRNCRHPKVPKTQRATQTPRPIQQAQPAKPQQQPARTATATTQSRPATSTAAAAAPVKMSWASVVQAPRPVREDPDDAFSTGAWMFDASRVPAWMAAQLPKSAPAATKRNARAAK
ncbi:hypothetical protein AMAG_14796 [Allomyces macrogynus ATCC 38327]|uniref:Guanylate-binding protein N-terminal domain-containing protein n=1 Tax=Allomyces macrogynus (strain ATCC 38327) TaxID=578462 RepID=A0A0L0T5A8_ALLM3|nr:hypothetical protein AMAG_14796 [Allomyces macrogynus ATCC 38327]|eukprot:KNE69958.1 hypothetical protein AMAG_14796 [Allomyces macrogynus ATCC 38327]